MGWILGVILIAVLLSVMWLLAYGIARMWYWLFKSPDPFPGLTPWHALLTAWILRRWF